MLTFADSGWLETTFSMISLIPLSQLLVQLKPLKSCIITRILTYCVLAINTTVAGHCRNSWPVILLRVDAGSEKSSNPRRSSPRMVRLRLSSQTFSALFDVYYRFKKYPRGLPLGWGTQMRPAGRVKVPTLIISSRFRFDESG